MTYQELLAAYDSLGQPGANGLTKHTPQWNDAFNGWIGNIMAQHGANTWEEVNPTWLTQQNTTPQAPPPTPQLPQLPQTPSTPQVPSVPQIPNAPTPPTPPPPPPTTPPAGDFTGLVTPNLPTVPVIQAPLPTQGGGNYNQTQNSTQGGQFSTSGQTLQQQSGTSGQAQTQTQTGTQTGTQSGSNTTAAVDTLGFGELLKNASGTAGALDNTRQSFLTDLVNNGGNTFQSQLDQGIRNSLTGPQMTGAGDSARARAAGYAAAEVGRKNVDQRLNATQQLAGPSALTTLSTAANPFVGQQSNTSGSSSTNTSGTSTGATAGWQNLVTRGAESQTGSTQGQASQAGAGLIPQGQPVKTGGCVLCTAAIELKLSKHHRVLRRVIAHKLHKDWPQFRNAARGYFAIFTPFAAWLLSHPRIAATLWPVAKGVVYEELRVSGRKLPFRLSAWLPHWIGHFACATVGRFFPVSGSVQNERIINIARRENILFRVQS